MWTDLVKDYNRQSDSSKYAWEFTWHQGAFSYGSPAESPTMSHPHYVKSMLALQFVFYHCIHFINKTVDNTRSGVFVHDLLGYLYFQSQLFILHGACFPCRVLNDFCRGKHCPIQCWKQLWRNSLYHYKYIDSGPPETECCIILFS